MLRTDPRLSIDARAPAQLALEPAAAEAGGSDNDQNNDDMGDDDAGRSDGGSSSQSDTQGAGEASEPSSDDDSDAGGEFDQRVLTEVWWSFKAPLQSLCARWGRRTAH